MTTTMKKIRMDHGISQFEMAEMLGVTQSAVSHWETGRREINIKMAVKIADALNCTVDDLIDRPSMHNE